MASQQQFLALALAPAAQAAEATVTATTAPGGSPPGASYVEPAQKIAPVLTDSGAGVTVKTGRATVLQLAVAMPAAARLAPGTYATAAGAQDHRRPSPRVRA